MRGEATIYPSLYQALRPLWPGGQELRKRQVELERTQWSSREELEALQLDRLRKLVRHAYDSIPYYHRVFLDRGIHPDDVKSIRDFQALPFLTREAVNHHLADLVTPFPGRMVMPNSTGGSTGVPMRFFMEKAFDWWDAALELRGRGWYGVAEGERVAFVWGAPSAPGWRLRLKSALKQERLLNAFDLTEQNMQAFSRMLIRWQPGMLRAYGSAITLFARYLSENHITGIQPKLIETSAEKVTLPQRRLLERTFNCPVADIYSARELGTIAFQCPFGGLHVCETRYLEVVAGGQPVQPGQLGEVVITSLHQYAMPFIRYKIGDMAVLQPEPCPCGRNLPTLSEVAGRIQDFLVTSDGRFVHGGYFPHTFRLYPEIIRYQVHQPDRTHLEVRLVCKSPVNPDWLASIQCELVKCFGANMNISIVLVDGIPLTPAGKHRFIISEVKPDFV